MKKGITIFILVMFSMATGAQNIRSLKWWRDKGLLKTFDKDISTLGTRINDIGNKILTPLKQGFDTCRNITDDSTRKILFDTIRNKYLIGIETNINGIEGDSFYTDTILAGYDSSFLFYYTNKELKDYTNTLKSFSSEAKFLIDSSNKKYTMSEFNNASFLNAYYNVSISRSLLLAAMDNLERHFLLGDVADNIIKYSLEIKDTLRDIDTLLLHSFRPYKNFKTSRTILNNPQYPSDKISTAANVILYDNRRNRWWRTLVGGLAGGLVAGLLVNAIK